MKCCISPPKGISESWPEADDAKTKGIRTGIPLDLSQSTEPQQLAGWVHQEVEQLTEEGPPSAVRAPGLAEINTLLSILSFAYLTGLFASADIAGACRSNAHIRLVSGNHIPHELDLSAFRRKHRGLLVSVLARVLTRFVRAHADSGDARSGAVFIGIVHENAVERLDVARHMDRAEG